MIHYTKIVFVVLTQMICFSHVIFGAQVIEVVHHGILIKNTQTNDTVLQVYYPNADRTNLRDYSENLGSAIPLGSFVRIGDAYCKIAKIQIVAYPINHNNSVTSLFTPVSIEEVKRLNLEEIWQKTVPVIERLKETLPTKTVRHASLVPDPTENKITKTPKKAGKTTEKYPQQELTSVDKKEPVTSFSWSKSQLFGGGILFIVFIACVWKFTTR